jgi:hypothetical protein
MEKGDHVAYVLSGHWLGDHGMAGALGTIPVGQRWMQAKSA